MKKISISKLEATRGQRPDGYIESIYAAAEKRGSWLWISEKSLIGILKVHAPDRVVEVKERSATAIGGRSTGTIGKGPGTELKKLIGSFGLKPCGQCETHAAIMDRRGTDWCGANIDTIVGWLREEAKQRRIPFVDYAARIMVKAAIRRARRPVSETLKGH